MGFLSDIRPTPAPVVHRWVPPTPAPIRAPTLAPPVLRQGAEVIAENFYGSRPWNCNIEAHFFISHQNSNPDMCERGKDAFDAAIFSEWNWKSLGIQPKHHIILDGFGPALASYCMFLWLHVATVCRDFTVSRSCWVGSRSMRLSSSRWSEPDGWGWSSWTARLGLWLGCA